MASLLLVGNTRQYTFANAILAAHTNAHDRTGRGLDDIFVLHSPESERQLCLDDDWRRHLASHGVALETFSFITIDLKAGDDRTLKQVAHHVERFLMSLKRHEDVYVDLTNGTSQHKSILANIAFVIGAGRQFILNIHPLGLTSNDVFLAPEQLRHAYVELPAPSLLDDLAPIWLTEVRRFGNESRSLADDLAPLFPPGEKERLAFDDDIRNAISIWFRGKKDYDSAALGGAVRHAGRAFEELVRAVHASIQPGNIGRPKELHILLGILRDHLASYPTGMDPELFEDVTQLLRTLRNASTHGSHAPEFAGIRARLSIELLIAATRLFTILQQSNLLQPLEETAPAPGTQCSQIEGQPGGVYIFGLDGDDTGRVLEQLFQSNAPPASFTRFSKSVDEARKALEKKIKTAPVLGNILFSSGDDLLFEGHYDATTIEELRTQYSKITRQTCSVGFGRTPKDAYIALKMAKATPGKDAVVGIEIVDAARSA